MCTEELCRREAFNQHITPSRVYLGPLACFHEETRISFPPQCGNLWKFSSRIDPLCSVSPCPLVRRPSETSAPIPPRQRKTSPLHSHSREFSFVAAFNVVAG